MNADAEQTILKLPLIASVWMGIICYMVEWSYFNAIILNCRHQWLNLGKEHKCNWIRAKNKSKNHKCDVICLWSPLTFHGGQTGVRQQRQGEQKQEIHHWQAIVAERRSWGAEGKTHILHILFDRNGLD